MWNRSQFSKKKLNILYLRNYNFTHHISAKNTTHERQSNSQNPTMCLAQYTADKVVSLKTK